MRYSLAVAAIVGAVAARPQGYGHRHEHPGKVYHTNVVVETVVKYVTMTEGYGAPSNPTPTPEPVYQAPPPPVIETIVYQAPPPAPSAVYDSPPIIEQPTPTPEAPAAPAYTPPAYTPPPAAPAYTPPPAAPAPSADEPAYMATINKWRSAMGKPTLAYNTTLQAIVDVEVKEMNGALTHVTKPGVYGQVVAPGQSTDFGGVWLAGWVCEVPDTPGVGEQTCKDALAKNNFNHEGQTDHNEICTAERYKGVACGNYKGMWACDFTLYE